MDLVQQIFAGQAEHQSRNFLGGHGQILADPLQQNVVAAGGEEYRDQMEPILRCVLGICRVVEMSGLEAQIYIVQGSGNFAVCMAAVEGKNCGSIILEELADPSHQIGGSFCSFHIDDDLLQLGGQAVFDVI